MKWQKMGNHPFETSILLIDRKGQEAFALFNNANRAWYCIVPGNRFRLPDTYEPYAWCQAPIFHEDDLNPVEHVVVDKKHKTKPLNSGDSSEAKSLEGQS